MEESYPKRVLKNGKLNSAKLWTSSLMDKGKYKKMEEKLIESETRYNNLFNNLTIGYACYRIAFDTKGNPVDYVVIELNSVYEKIIGCTQMEVINKSIDVIYNGYSELGIRLKEVLRQVKLTGEPKVEEIYSPNMDKWYNASFYCHKPGFIAGTFADISHIKNNNEKLLKTQFNGIYRMIDTISLPLIRISFPEFLIVDINQGAYKLVRRMRPDIKNVHKIKGKSIKDIFSEVLTQEDCRYWKQDFYTEGTVYVKEVRYFCDGIEKFSNVIIEPVFLTEGEVYELIIVVIDKTKEGQMNSELEETLKQQEEFLANISHELKTPLSVIQATTQLFKQYFKNGSLEDRNNIIEKHINTIMQNTNRLSKFINNIVDLSRIEAGLYELNISNNNIVEITEGIVKATSEFIEAKGMSIVFYSEIKSKVIACDSEKIEKVLLNLLSNAIKFSDVGNRIEVNIVDRGVNIEISVIDNGIGIDKNYLDTIFDRFKQVDKSFSRNVEGTGIGLSIAKSVAKLHGGDITVESRFGSGSKFSLLLPSNRIDSAEESTLVSEIAWNNNAIQVELSDIY